VLLVLVLAAHAGSSVLWYLGLPDIRTSISKLMVSTDSAFMFLDETFLQVLSILAAGAFSVMVLTPEEVPSCPG
jgi:hypothetical protein